MSILIESAHCKHFISELSNEYSLHHCIIMHLNNNLESLKIPIINLIMYYFLSMFQSRKCPNEAGGRGSEGVVVTAKNISTLTYFNTAASHALRLCCIHAAPCGSPESTNRPWKVCWIVSNITNSFISIPYMQQYFLSVFLSCQNCVNQFPAMECVHLFTGWWYYHHIPMHVR